MASVTPPAVAGGKPKKPNLPGPALSIAGASQLPLT